MDADQIRTFLAVVAHGSFLEAARRIHVTQSTVSARIHNLEVLLGAGLFVRSRTGTVLTPAGWRFLRYAKSIMLNVEQARHDVGLPSRFRANVTLGARIALWDGLLPRWAGRMRERVPDVSIRSEVGLEDDLMRRLVEGTMDLALMYTPHHGAGLQVEHLFDETLVLVSSEPNYAELDDRYVYVEWGPAFDALHLAVYPGLERPAQFGSIGWLALQIILANGGACFIPDRVAAPHLETGRLHVATESPRFRLAAHVVYPLENKSPALETALDTLRATVAEMR